MSDNLKTNFIVFTDLDGTLLDHDTYSYQPAQEALEKLRATNTPLILASSKTASELIPLRSKLGFSHCPAIVENGAGLLPSETKILCVGSEYEQIIEVLNSAPKELRAHFRGFNDWSVHEVSGYTSLDLASAKRAKNRQFTEPGLWSGTQIQKELFLGYLHENGLNAQQGGRFLTISCGASKADQMREILRRYTNNEVVPTSVALGDAPNDIAMLQAADMGFVIKNNDNANLFGQSKPKHISYSDLSGPKGWNACILSLFT